MADYKGVLADLKARKAAIEKEHVDLETAIQAIERLAGSANNGQTELPLNVHAVPVHPRTFANMTMPLAIAKYFYRLNVREPQTIRQIMDALMAGGLKTKGNVRGHVYNTMHRLSREGGPYRHEPDGRWSVRGWGESSPSGVFSSIPRAE